MDAASPKSELSSIATALDDLTRRVTGIAERSTGTDLDWLATGLFEAERALGEARLRLDKIVEKLRA
jgi:hypothetical protein